MTSISNTLTRLEEDLRGIRFQMQRNVVVSAEGGVVVDRTARTCRLADAVTNVFKCMICHSLMTSPVSFASCCKQLLGCGTCLQSWFVNNDSCPHCRAEGMESISIPCFAELLQKVRDVYDFA